VGESRNIILSHQLFVFETRSGGGKGGEGGNGGLGEKKGEEGKNLDLGGGPLSSSSSVERKRGENESVYPCFEGGRGTGIGPT